MAAMSGCGKDKDKIADKQAPSVPSGIGITAVSSSEIKIFWNPSTDDSGKVKGYKIYRNNEHMAVQHRFQMQALIPRLSSVTKFPLLMKRETNRPILAMYARCCNALINLFLRRSR